MALRVTKYDVDDLARIKDPKTEIRADEHITLGLNGEVYEIDLTHENADKLTRKLEPYLRAGRKVQGRHAPRSASSRRRSAQIRSWAQAQGIQINPRGRIPAGVVQQYEASAA